MRWRSGRTWAMSIAAVVGLGIATQAPAGPINPANFPSGFVGVLNSGHLRFNTSGAMPMLMLNDIPLLMGRVHAQPGGTEVAVFSFRSLSIQNATIEITGDRPIAILGQEDIFIQASIDVSGQGRMGRAFGGDGGMDNTGEIDGNGEGMGAGLGGIFGLGGGGAGYGGAGGIGGANQTPGGVTHHPLDAVLWAGSGGGAGGGQVTESDLLRGGDGGAGGGGIEIGAMGTLRLSGQILANGGHGGNGEIIGSAHSGGGAGGAGGAIYLHAASIELSGGLTANGGHGGSGGTAETRGGGGGGGRIRVEAGRYTLCCEHTTTSVSGGLNGMGALSGQIGVAELMVDTFIIAADQNQTLPLATHRGMAVNFSGQGVEIQSGGRLTLNENLSVNHFVNNSGALTFANGSTTLNVQQNLDHTTGATTLLLGGLTPGDGYNQILVDQHAALGGTLSIGVTDGFTPLPGQTYTLMTYGSREGTFGQIINATPFAGLIFDVHYDENALTLTLSATPGDANLDGNVSIGDLTILAEYFGQSDGQATWRTGDFTHDGNVSIGDLTLLAEYFGVTGVGLGSIAAVPLPTSAWAGGAVMALLAGRLARQRATRQKLRA